MTVTRTQTNCHNCQIGHIAGSTLILSNQTFGPKMGLYFQESSLALFGLEPARGFALTSALTTLYFDTVPHVRSVVPTTRRDQVALTHFNLIPGEHISLL